MLDRLEEANLRVVRCREPKGRFLSLIQRGFGQVLLAHGQYLLAWRLLRAANQLDFEPDIVYTSSTPYEAHLTGYLLKKMRGWKWVAEFRDPLTLYVGYRKVNPLSRWLDRRFERNVYSYADGVVFNTQRHLEESAEAFALDGTDSKFIVCQNGFDPEDKIPQLSSSKSKSFHIAYIGGIRGLDHEREFVNLVLENADFLSKRSIVIQFIGNGSEHFEDEAKRSGGVLEVVPFREQKELARYWANVQALIMLPPPSPPRLRWAVPHRKIYANGHAIPSPVPSAYSATVPQKLYTYFQSGRPILAIYPPGEALSYMEAIGGHVIRHPGDDDFQTMISELLEKRYPVSDVAKVQHFNQKILFEELSEWLEQVAGLSEQPQPVAK